EAGSLAAGDHRGHVARIEARRSVTDAVNTGVLGPHRTIRESPVDLPRRQSGVKELRSSHDSVLPPGDLRGRPLYRPALTTHTVANPGSIEDSPPTGSPANPAPGPSSLP